MLCVWTNSSFSGITMGFKVASYSQAQEKKYKLSGSQE